jgi:hypothetical protein
MTAGFDRSGGNNEEDMHYYSCLVNPSTASQPALGARLDGESTARVELEMNERTGIDTRSGLAVANAAGLDGLPSKDRPVRVVLSEK